MFLKLIPEISSIVKLDKVRGYDMSMAEPWYKTTVIFPEGLVSIDNPVVSSISKIEFL